MQLLEHLFDRYPWVRVVYVELPDGKPGYTDGDTIYVNEALTAASRLCTVVHEFVHMIVGWLPEEWMPYVSYWLAKVELVEKITSAMLIPFEALADAVRRVGLGSATAELLGVDEQTLRDRLRDLGPRERSQLAVSSVSGLLA
jgi:hypothetical protein